VEIAEPFEPVLGIEKTANTERALVGDSVFYRIEVVYEGREPLGNVVITDNRLGEAVNGTVRVYKSAATSGEVLLVNGTDYELAGNTITLLDDLQPGESIIIRYTAIMRVVGNYRNVAGVAGETDTHGRMEREDDHTVVVRTPDNNDDYYYDDYYENFIPDPAPPLSEPPDVPIEIFNEDVPLTEVPDEPVTILEDAVPQSAMPRTGLSEVMLRIWIYGLVFSVLGSGVLMNHMRKIKRMN